MIPPQLPAVPGNPSPEALAERARLWQRRLEREKKLCLHEGDERAFKSFHMQLASICVTDLLKFSGLYAQGRENAVSPVLRRLDWCPPRLPAALDGLTILHLSDPHFSRFDRRLTEGAARCVDGVAADYVFITGDYRFGHFGPVEHVPHHLREVLHGVTAREGIYATLGNHDLGTTALDLRALDIDVLVNEGRRLAPRGVPLWLGGTDDAHGFRSASLNAALDGRAPGEFTVLLTHTPELALAAARAEVDLYLCGHTHGGQICLPGGIPLKLNARAPLRFARGPWRERGMLGLTTNGLGTTDIPLRYNCPAECHLITLRAAGSQ